MDTPRFKYHPDPFSTGSAKVSAAVCECCGRAAGHIYAGPIYSEKSPESLCLWCVADGSAHAKYAATFCDDVVIGGNVVEWKEEFVNGRRCLWPVKHEWSEVPEVIAEEIARRTPGFSGWQQEKWWTHCGDGGAFLGVVGNVDPKLLEGPSAAEFVAKIKENEGFSEKEWNWYVRSNDKEHSLTTYIFRCLHCATIGGYSDCA